MPARKRNYRVGAHVRFDLGGSRVEGTIVEDRGPIGAKGRHLVRVQYTNETTRQVELPVDELAPVSHR